MEEEARVFLRVPIVADEQTNTGSAAVYGAHALQPSEYVGHMRTERAAVYVDFVDHDVPEPGEEPAPFPVVVRQDAAVEHVGVGDDEIGRALYPLPLVPGRVAVEGAELPPLLHHVHQLAECLFLVP